MRAAILAAAPQARNEIAVTDALSVSTQRVHARGPMGLEQLTSYKWVVEGGVPRARLTLRLPRLVTQPFALARWVDRGQAGCFRVCPFARMCWPWLWVFFVCRKVKGPRR
jgi:hypothetical protein